MSLIKLEHGVGACADCLVCFCSLESSVETSARKDRNKECDKAHFGDHIKVPMYVPKCNMEGKLLCK